MHRILALTVVLTASVFAHPVLAGPADDDRRLFIIGQDLGAVRDYHASDCCPAPDANTAYISLWNLTDPTLRYGGLGLDPSGQPMDEEWDYTAGPANLWKVAKDFPGGLVIGLSMTENHHPRALELLAEGAYDAHIDRLAQFLNTVDEPVWLRIAYEFEGHWNQGYGDPDRYVAAWIHLVDRLRAKGVSNTQFVWQSSTSPVDDILDQGHDDMRRWYPGDDYVDWMGISWFLPPDAKPSVPGPYEPPTQGELVEELLAFARERGKPVMVAESTPQGYDLAQGFRANFSPLWDGPQRQGETALDAAAIWQAWYQPLFEFLHDNQDVVKALAYINVNWDAQDMWDAPWESGFWGDSRLQANPEVARRFSAALTEWRGR